MQLLKYAVQELLLLSKPLLPCPKAKQLVTVLTQLLVVFTEPNLNPFGLPSYLLFQFAMLKVPCVVLIKLPPGRENFPFL
mgnify:FL=1